MNSNIIFSSWGGHLHQGPGQDCQSSCGEGEQSSTAVDLSFLPDNFQQQPLKAMIGWDGLVIADPSLNVVELCRQYMHALAEQSCGKCSPCPGGTRAMAELLDKICRSKGEQADIQHLQTIAETVIETSRCGIGKVGPVALVHALKHFPDAFAEAVESGVPESDTSFFSKTTAPCIEACPLHLNVPQYVDHIREGRFDKSLEVIRCRLPLPGVLGRTCFRPCESQCRRANMDEPIAIKSLKRFVADEALKKGEPAAKPCAPAGETGKVVIIGAGPAGLSCAYHLALRGHKVKVYEMLQEPGGMAAVGIPDYRLPRDVLRHEAELIQQLGVDIHYGIKVGRDVLLTDLQQEYDAVFVSVGAQNSSLARVQGEDQGYQGYIPGVQYLRAINEGYDPYPEGRRVAVIGGGNVAIDCVRTALRMGKDDVSILYRRTRAEMPADEVEIHEAEEENVSFHYLTAPLRIVAENGRVVGLECQRMELGEPDSSGRRRPQAVPGSEFIFECDTVVSAIGQKVDISFLVGADELKTTDWNTIAVEPVTRQTSVAKIFSAGDCETGPDALVTAAAGGLRAALSIDSFVAGKPLEHTLEDHFESFMKYLKLYDHNEAMDKVATQAREQLKALPVDVRTQSYEEVEKGFTRAEAMAEAARCLHCYRVVTVAV